MNQAVLNPNPRNLVKSEGLITRMLNYVMHRKSAKPKPKIRVKTSLQQMQEMKDMQQLQYNQTHEDLNTRKYKSEHIASRQYYLTRYMR